MKTSAEQFQEGVDLLRSGELKSALNIFNRLIDVEPSNADYWSERGVVYFHLNERKNALIDMDKAVALQPHKSYRYSSRAYIRGHYKMLKEAISDYEKAIELDPSDAIAHNNLGLVQEQMGYMNKAKKNFSTSDELLKETGGRTDLGIEGPEVKARNIQKEIDEEKKENNIWKELKTLSSKEGRSSFLRFVQSGFKKT